MPLSLTLTAHRDACQRLCGASSGADAEVERSRAAGKPVCFSLKPLASA